MKARVVECFCLDGAWYAYLDWPEAWIGWEYKVRICGLEARGEGLYIGKAVLKVGPLPRPLPRGGTVEFEARPVMRLYPA